MTFHAGDWRDLAHYDFAERLSAALWAWQSLHRNPEYQADWDWFQGTWLVLEADYGRPPDRDFQAWKRDARAYRAQVGSTICSSGEDPCGGGDKVLIECWMGAKWGFYKFPVDPARTDLAVGEELCWRPVQIQPVIVDGQDRRFFDSETRVALGFDLRRPLPEQVSAAERLLQLLQRRWRRCCSPTNRTPPRGWRALATKDGDLRAVDIGISC